MLGFFEKEMGIAIQVQAKKTPAKVQEPEGAGEQSQVKVDGEKEKAPEESKQSRDLQSEDATVGDGSASTAAPAGSVLKIQDGLSLRAINMYKDSGS